MASGLFQLAVYKFSAIKGVDNHTFALPTQLAKKHTLLEDRDALVHDTAVALFNQLLQVLPRVELEHKFICKLMPSLNLLVGIDTRDLEDDPDDDDPFIEDQPSF